MAHFAQMNADIVVDVIVVNNACIDNLPFPESEPVGIVFCQSLYGSDTHWVQTSYNGSFRYNYAGIGYSFDPTAGTNGAFIAPYPGPGWVLNTDTYQWEKEKPAEVALNTPPTVI